MKKTVKDVDVSGKRILVRADFNVPLENGEVADDARIRACLPTIVYLLQRRARVILCSHLGRPKGEIKEDLRLTPVARRLTRLLDRDLTLLGSCVGERVRSTGLPGGPLRQRRLWYSAPGPCLQRRRGQAHPGRGRSAHGGRTLTVARILADLSAETIIGGGDTGAALALASVTERMAHVSTGGEAFLSFIQGETLPGLAVLQDRH